MDTNGYDPYDTITAKAMEVIEWQEPAVQDFGDTITVEILLPQHGDLLAGIVTKTM